MLSGPGGRAAGGPPTVGGRSRSGNGLGSIAPVVHESADELSAIATGIEATYATVGVLRAALLALTSIREVVPLLESVDAIGFAYADGTRVVEVIAAPLLALLQRVVAACTLEELVEISGDMNVLQCVPQRQKHKLA